MWHLGGPSSLRGYDPRRLTGTSFVRARGELALAYSFVWISLFTDVAWAGESESYRFEDTLYSAGVGLAVADGLIRLDSAWGLRRPRAFRLDLYLKRYPPDSMKIRRSRPFSLVGVPPRLLLVVFVAACDPVGPDAGEPPPLRPRDGLLADGTLQGVVDLQVQRDGGALTAMLMHARADVRARAALALGSVQAGEALAPLLVAVGEDLDPNVRRDAAFALGQLGQASSVRELAAAFEAESDADVRDRILEALGKIASPEAANVLLSAEVAAAEKGRRALALSVNGAVKGVRSPAAQDFLLARLDHPDADVRAGAAYYFGHQADGSAWSARVSRVRDALRSYGRDDPAAMYLIQALGRISDPSDTNRLADWARSATDWRSRSDAMVALAGRQLEPAARDALMAGLDDPMEHVAMNAATALAGSAQPPSVLGRLKSWIERNPTRAVVMEPLIGMLARQNEREFVLGWLDALDETDEAGWRIGLSAIGSLSGREVLDRIRVAVNSPSESIAGAAVAAMSQHWAVDKRDPQLRDVYFAICSEALNSGNPQLEFTAAQILTDPLLFPLGSQQLLLDAYQLRLSQKESREAAEFSAPDRGDRGPGRRSASAAGARAPCRGGPSHRSERYRATHR